MNRKKAKPTNAERYAILRELLEMQVIRIDMFKFPWQRVTDLDKLVDERFARDQKAAA